MAKTIMIEEQYLSPKLFSFVNGIFDSVNIVGRTIIGRSTANNSVDIDLSVGFVSRRHGEINFDEDGVYYIDTDSTNGTYYNGKKLYPRCKQYIHNGDVLQIYRNAPNSSEDFVCLIFCTDYSSGYETGCIEINDNMAEINIGRSGNKNILLHIKAVSENHASFFTAKHGWAIIDHKSTNGVYLNNYRIDSPKYLKVGDCVRIANTHFVYTGNSIAFQKVKVSNIHNNYQHHKAHEDMSLKIHIVERSVWQRAKKLMLLQNIDMTVHAGEMVLILGGSGAGKTTFMNAVMGYEKAEGTIKHGDTDVYEDFESMKYKIGFVPQQDLLRGSDSVYDTLENAAEMKIPASLKKEERNDRIEMVLEKLGLQRERESLVSKLSGGQRKRLSIAIEYIANPSLFFLDEPDSGLDGVMAKSLMQNLRHIADEGKTVMLISHAPDRAADLFDKVVVLAKSVKDNCGHLAFFGTVDDALNFFDTDSLEGIVKRINREDEGGDGMSDYFIEKYSKQIIRR